jgi:protein-S-isoprenylcysteine O-methyltransferase Ste14
MPDATPDNAGVKLPPPLIYVVPLALAWWLGRHWPLPLSTATAGAPAVGWALVALGALCTFPAALAFLAARTAIVPIRPAAHLVTTGLYRRTRNPMYLGFTIAYVGGTVLAWNWWPVLFLPLILWAMNGYVIAREERYLDARFGQSYRDYRAQVRRWL